MRHMAALVLTGMLIAFYVVLLVVGERGGRDDRRETTLLVVGSYTNSRSGNVVDSGPSAAINAEEAPASASWNFYSYQIGKLVRHARLCSMDVALVGVDLTSAAADGSADILVNGETIEHITFSRERRALFPLAHGRLVPANEIPQLIELVPLDREYGILVPIPHRLCSSSALEVGVRLEHASWTIADAGVKLAYQPTPFTGFRATLIATLGIFIALVGIAAIHLVITRMYTLGIMPLLATLAVLIVSPLTFDQWDYRLWTSFGEVAIFGGGDPARLWFGSPLWAFVPSLFSIIAAAATVITGHGGIASAAVFMKIGMGIAYCYSAFQIALRAPTKMRTTWALIALLVPLGLYELAAGYRELFAVALAIASLTATMRRRLLPGTILAVLAASIGEELMPMVLLPAAVALTLPISHVQRTVRAVGLAALGASLLVGEWLVLIPRETATAAVSYRLGAAPLGGASWAGALAGLGILPAWLSPTSPLLGTIVFLLLAAMPIWRLITIVRSAAKRTARSDQQLAGVFIMLVGALLVAFRGTDPNLWYGFVALLLWFFATAFPTNPFPLFLGTIEGLAFYSTVGFREFVNHAYFWPVDKGLLGTLSSLRNVFDLMAAALTVAIIIAICRNDTLRLFSQASPRVSLLFLCAVFSASTDSLPLDIVIVLATATLLGGVLRAHTQRLHNGERRTAVFRGGTVVTLAMIGAYSGLRELLAGLCASTLCVSATLYELSICDLILGAGGIAALAAQTGSGPVANLATAALYIVMLVTIATVFGLRAARKRNTQPR
jgi:hypothetical protein